MTKRTRNKNIIIIGGGGFIGSYLAKDLSQIDDNNVIVLDRQFDIFNKFEIFNKIENNSKSIYQNIKIIEYDLTSEDPIPFTKLINYLDPDKEILIFNLAAIVGPKLVISKINYMDYELQLQLKIKKIIEFLIDKLYIINSFIYFSTSEVYGDQVYQNEHHELILPNIENKNFDRNRYSISKNYFENYWKEFFINLKLKNNFNNFKYLIIRPFNVIGPFQRNDFVIPIMINKVLNNEEIIVYGDGSQRRNFIYIDDFIYALKLIIDSDLDYEIFNIANLNNTITIKSLAYKIIQIMKRLKNIDYTKDIKFVQDNILIGQKDRLAGTDRLYNELKFRPEYDLDRSIENILKKY